MVITLNPGEGPLDRANRSLTTLFFVVLADMIGFGFIIPLLPYYAKQFGASDLLIGLLGATYPFGQFFAAPLIGRLSDKFGRKRALLLSVGGTFVSLLTLGFAKSLPLIFISRLTDGLTGGNITVAQSYISDLTDARDRAKSLGLIGAAFGLGFIVGPAFGGLLSRFGYSVPAFVAAAISFTNLLLISFLLPDSKPANAKEVSFTFGELRNTIGQPHLASLLLSKVFYSLAFTMFEAGFALFAMRRLNLEVSSTSFILTYVGVLVAFSQGFLVRIVTKRASELQILQFAFPLVLPFLTLYSLAPNVPLLLSILTPLSVASAFVGVSVTSLVTKSVSRDKVGGTLGLFNSVDSVTRIFSPILTGLVIQFLGPASKGLVEGSLVLASVVVYFTLYVPQARRFFLRNL